MCCCDIESKISVLAAAGVTRIDEDVLAREFLAERFGEADQSSFRCAVVRRVGIAFLAGDRRNDDAPVARLQHVRDDRAAGQIRPDQIDVDDAAPHVGREFPGGAVSAGDARVVDEHIDLAVCDDRLLRDGVDGRFVGEFHDGSADGAFLVGALQFSSALVRASRSPSTSHIATSAPDCSARSATASPIPRASPVTTTTLPADRYGSCLCLLIVFRCMGSCLARQPPTQLRCNINKGPSSFNLASISQNSVQFRTLYFGITLIGITSALARVRSGTAIAKAHC